MGEQLCEYKTCTKEATTKGFVIARYTNKPEYVWACDKHKKMNGFFEETAAQS